MVQKNLGLYNVQCTMYAHHGIFVSILISEREYFTNEKMRMNRMTQRRPILTLALNKPSTCVRSQGLRACLVHNQTWVDAQIGSYNLISYKKTIKSSCSFRSLAQRGFTRAQYVGWWSIVTSLKMNYKTPAFSIKNARIAQATPSRVIVRKV